MSCFQIKFGIFAIVVLLLCKPAISYQVDAYIADTIWTGEGEPIHDAVLVVVDGKVKAMGPRDSVVIPTDARQHRLVGRSIMPGIVVAKTQLAGTQDAPKTLTPQIMAIDGFDYFADQSAYLESGITSVQISAGDNRLMPGVGAVVKLSGDDLTKRLLLDRESMRIVLDENARKPPRIYEPPVGPVSEDRPLDPTQPQLSTLAGSLAGLRLLFEGVPEDSDAAMADQDEVIAALARHLQESGVVRISAKTAPEIRGAIGLAKQFGFQVILTDCQDLEPFVDDFADWSTFVKGIVLVGLSPGKITNPTAAELEKQNEPWEFTRELLESGIPVAVQPSSDGELRDILFVAGQFMKDDLSQNQLVSMLTHAPAKMLGVDDRVGELAVGKDADFVVLNNSPLAMHTAVMATYVDGVPAFDRDSKTKTTVVRAAKVYTGDGRIIDNARVVVKGKTVRGIGTDVSAPVDAEVKNFANAVIVPGFVDLGTGIGLGGPLSGSVRMNTKLGEQLYADDPAIKYAREQGMTTVLLGSMSSSSGTPLVAFKLGDDVRVIADPVAIRFKVSDNTASSIAALKKTLQAGKAYHESFLKYDKDLAAYNEKQAADKKLAAAAEAKAQAAEKAKAEKAKKEATESKGSEDGKPEGKKEEAEKPVEKPADETKEKPADEGQDKKEGAESSESKDDAAKAAAAKAAAEKAKAEKTEAAPKEPKKNEALEPYRALLTGKIPAVVEARKSPAIKEALKLFVDEFKIRTVIAGADDLARFPDLLKGYDVGVCAGPEMNITIDKRTTNLPQLLANEQVEFAFQSKGTTGVGQLPAAIQYSVSKGLGAQDGLRALTAAPAELLSKEMTFGSLKPGNDADLIVLSGPPFENATKILAVMIDGSWVYDREEQE